MMSKLISNNRKLIISLALFLAAASLMGPGFSAQVLQNSGYSLVSNITSPFEKASDRLRDAFSYHWSHYLWLVGLEEENNQLKRELRTLEQLNVRVSELEEENSRFRKLLNYSDGANVSGVGASVIGRSSSPWVSTITVDRGSQHGLSSGLAVVDGNTIVGQITAVGKRFSEVLLITDKSSAVDVLVQPSRASGVLEGELGESMKLRYVTDKSGVSKGDKIITSGLDGIYPKGIYVGTVSTVSSSHASLFHKITVKPALDVERLESVLVLLKDA